MLIPREQIQFRRDEQGRLVAFTPLLPGCEATADREPEAVRALQRKAHDHLRALRNDGEPIPEPFAGVFRRNTRILIVVGLTLAIALGVALALLRPGDRTIAYNNLLPGVTAAEVQTLLGRPDEVIDLREREGYLVLKQAGVVVLWRYREIEQVGPVELQFDRVGTLVAKRPIAK